MNIRTRLSIIVACAALAAASFVLLRNERSDAPKAASVAPRPARPSTQSSTVTDRELAALRRRLARLETTVHSAADQRNIANEGVGPTHDTKPKAEPRVRPSAAQRDDAFADAIRGDERDAEWEHELSEEVEGLVAKGALADSTLRSVECSSSLCLAEFSHEKPSGARKLGRALLENLSEGYNAWGRRVAQGDDVNSRVYLWKGRARALP